MKWVTIYKALGSNEEKEGGIKKMSYLETNQDECRVNFEEWFNDDGASYIQKRVQDLAKVYRWTFEDNYERSAFQPFISKIKEGDNALT